MSDKKIVVLGAGFAGVRCALDLVKGLSEKYSVVLVDKEPYHLYPMWLPNVATLFSEEQITLKPEQISGSVAIPISLIIEKHPIVFLQKEVVKVDLGEQAITFKDGTALGYEYLVLALGSETNYFNIPGLKENSFGLKDIQDSINLRNKIEELFRTKCKTGMIYITVAGSGPTGIQLTGDIADFTRKLAKKYNFPLPFVSISIVEGLGSVLPGAKPKVIKLATKRLKKLNVKLLLNSFIEKYENGKIFLKGGKTVPTDLLIWTAGIRANSVLEKIEDLPLQKKSLIVTKSLRTLASCRVFGIGDNTVFYFDPEGKRIVPATAQAAIEQAGIVAENIKRSINIQPLKEYHPRQPGALIPIAGKYAIADINFLIFDGIPAWILKQLIALDYYRSILPFREALKIWLGGKVRVQT